MKTRCYERLEGIQYLIILLFFIEGMGMIYLREVKMRKYNLYSAILTSKNEIVIIANNINRKVIYKNTFLYLKNKKKKYTLIEDHKLNKNTHEIHLSVSLNNQYKTNDILVVAIEKQKINIYEILKDIWGGD